VSPSSGERPAGGRWRVAAITHRADQVGARADRVELLAQPRDQHVDGTVEWIGGASAGPIEDLVTGQHPAWPLHEAGEEIEFGTGERQPAAAIVGELARVEVDDEAIEREAPRGGSERLRAAAPQHRAHARKQLAWSKGLHQSRPRPSRARRPGRSRRSWLSASGSAARPAT